MRKKAVLVFCILNMLICSSCSITDKLGFDTYDYMGESVTSVHDINDEDALAISEMLEVLVSDTAELTTFDNMSDAIRDYRDAVLMYMLRNGYAKYSGNTELIEKAEREYPEYTVAQIIPATEFESVMYRYFGGNVKITHRDGERFKYLSKVGAYISPAVAENELPKTEITALSETDKTYRVRFKVITSETDEAKEYFALVIKRDDGTLYFKKLLMSDDVK